MVNTGKHGMPSTCQLPWQTITRNRGSKEGSSAAAPPSSGAFAEFRSAAIPSRESVCEIENFGSKFSIQKGEFLQLNTGMELRQLLSGSLLSQAGSYASGIHTWQFLLLRKKASIGTRRERSRFAQIDGQVDDGVCDLRNRGNPTIRETSGKRPNQRGRLQRPFYGCFYDASGRPPLSTSLPADQSLEEGVQEETHSTALGAPLPR